MDRSTACRILDLLKKEYAAAGDAGLAFENPFRLLILTILSAQTTDRSVTLVEAALFCRYPTMEALAQADPEDVVPLIRTIGYYRSKARYIVGAARYLLDEHGGEVPRRMEDLVRVPGVGRKTANIVLSRGFGIHEGIAVDTHVRRLSQRIGLSDESTPEKIEPDLMALYPKSRWGEINDTLIHHGRKVCRARHPAHEVCVIRDYCRCYLTGERCMPQGSQ
jgi:endonuclease-3